MTGLAGAAIPQRSGIVGDVDRAVNNALELESRLCEIIHRLGLSTQSENKTADGGVATNSLINSIAALNSVTQRNHMLTATILKGL